MHRSGGDGRLAVRADCGEGWGGGGGMGEPLARFPLTLPAAWRMIGVSGFGCLGLMRGEVYDATYDAIVKRQIA